METGNKKAYAAIALAAVNVAVFLYLAFGGPTEDGAYMLEHGAMYVPRMLEYREYYRLFSSMFLHFGFQHLFNNMVMLLMVGWNLELEIGSVRFLIIYLLSGLGGNLLSGYLDIRLQDYAVSAGASGAIFGSWEPCSMWYTVITEDSGTFPAEACWSWLPLPCTLDSPVPAWIMPPM